MRSWLMILKVTVDFWEWYKSVQCRGTAWKDSRKVGKNPRNRRLRRFSLKWRGTSVSWLRFLEILGYLVVDNFRSFPVTKYTDSNTNFS